MAVKHARFADFFGVLDGTAAPAGVPYVGDVFRSAPPKWMSRPYRLTGVGSVLAGGRWNVINLVPAVYFSETMQVALAEAQAVPKRYAWPLQPYPAKTYVAFHLELQALLDLTAAAALKALKVKTKDIINCDWKFEQSSNQEPLTQALSRAAFEKHMEGLIVPSARASGRNIIVFPTNLRPGSKIDAHDESSIPFVHGL